MGNPKSGLLAFVFASCSLLSVSAFAVNIALVTVGNPGNAPGAVNFGKVDYTYQIGKFDVTAGQYCEFLNAVAPTDTHGLYTANMDNSYNPLGCNIKRTGESGSYTYVVAADWANRPVNLVSWTNAARFCNWLTNGQPRGDQGLTTTEDGSYYINGSDRWTARKSSARYVLPTENEWYKAACYDPAKPGGPGYWLYATRSDSVPSNVLDPNGTNNANYDAGTYPAHQYTIGAPYYRTEVGAFANSPSAYGTYDQCGNILQWTESQRNGLIVIRGSDVGYTAGSLRGGGSLSVSGIGMRESTGFRIAYVPEPTTCVLLLAGGMSALRRRVLRR